MIGQNFFREEKKKNNVLKEENNNLIVNYPNEIKIEDGLIDYSQLDYFIVNLDLSKNYPTTNNSTSETDTISVDLYNIYDSQTNPDAPNFIEDIHKYSFILLGFNLQNKNQTMTGTGVLTELYFNVIGIPNFKIYNNCNPTVNSGLGLQLPVLDYNLASSTVIYYHPMKEIKLVPPQIINQPFNIVINFRAASAVQIDRLRFYCIARLAIIRKDQLNIFMKAMRQWKF